MSARRTPSPPNYPKSRPQSNTTRQIAATQRPPGAPHILPPLFENSGSLSHGPPAYLEPQSQYSPAPQEIARNPLQQHLPFHPQPRRSSPPLDLRTRQRSAAAPLDRLLHPVPDTPPHSNRYRPGYAQRQSWGLDPLPSSHMGGPQSEYGVHREHSETPRQYTSRDRYTNEVEPSYSPGYAGHGSSESSRHGSTNSSGSYGTDRDQYIQSNISSNNVGSITNRYILTVRQQPIAARACGFGERDRRVIDPPPIVQLSLRGFDPSSSADVAELHRPFNVVHCALLAVSPETNTDASDIDVTAIPDPGNAHRLSRRLMGTLVASPFIANDPEVPNAESEDGRRSCFFIFPDLSCRTNGLYRLRFSLMRVNVESMFTGGTAGIVAVVDSDVFEVFSAKDFPGMRASTSLTRDLKRQGAAISVKKGNEGKSAKKTKKGGSSDSNKSGSDASDDRSIKTPQKKRTG